MLANSFTVIPSDYHIWNQLDFEKFLFTHQDKDITIWVTEGCDCEEIGLFDTLDLFKISSVTIKTYNSIQQSFKYNIDYHPRRFNFFCIDSTEYYTPYQYWNQSKTFSAFYNRPIWHRVGLASYMLDQHPDKILLNFRADPYDIDGRRYFELTQLFINHPKSLECFVRCLDQLPSRLEALDGYTVGASTQQHTDQLCEFYPSVLVDIVAETFVNGNLFFATEKTVRPMLLKKPFIAMAAKNHLLYLRQMGFKTFNEFWNEDYDSYEGPFRYQKILTLIDTLAAKSLSELNSMYQSMQPILEHNINLLKNQNYSKIITRIEQNE